MTGAESVVQALTAAGVRHLFALSGNQNLPIFDACIGSGLRLIHTRHEAAAVHMADGWGRLTGEPGVALLTAGPGHCNGVTGLFVARAAESPLVMISGHSPHSQAGMGAFQELDQAAMAAPAAKWSHTATGTEPLADLVARGLKTAVSGRPGPVHLSLPMDLLQAEAAPHAPPVAERLPQTGPPLSEDEAGAAPPADWPPEDAPRLSEDETTEILDRLQSAARPLILAGPAMSRGDNWQSVRALQSASGVPALPCESPRGVDDPWLRGATHCLAEADLVLLLGKRLDHSLRFGEPPAFSESVRFLAVDAEEALNPTRLDGCFRADPAGAVVTLSDAAAQGSWKDSPWGRQVREARAEPLEWRAHRGSDASPIHPLALCERLQPFLDRDGVFVCDGGEFGQWMQGGLSAGLRLINGPSGSIGSSLPMGMAAKVRYPERPVLVFQGDGTFGFHALEIDTCLRYGLPVVVIVGNDARWNAEVQLQIRQYGPDRTIGCDLLPTRYDRVAEALGGFGERVEDPGELAPAVERALASGLPAVIDVTVDGLPAPVF